MAKPVTVVASNRTADHWKYPEVQQISVKPVCEDPLIFHCVRDAEFDTGEPTVGFRGGQGEPEHRGIFQLDLR